MTTVTMLALLLAQAVGTINIGLRDGTVVEDVPVRQGRLPRAALRIAGVRLGVDTLASVQHRLGRTRLLDESPDPHASLAVCYLFPSADTAVFFESDDLEQDPGEQGIAWSATLSRPSKADSRCLGIAGPASVQTDSGLRLGMSRSEIVRRLGSPGKATHLLLLYVFQSPGWIGSIEIHLDKGQVTSITTGEWTNS
jgi:hypothetical protein